MPLHPAPPQDLDALAEGYAQAVQAVIDLGHSLRPGDLERETDCPGWTVFDQIAHVTSGEAMVAGDPVPDLDVSGYGYVRHEFGERTEKYVESRRGRHPAELLDELEALLAERLAFYRDPDTTLGTPTVGPFGATTVGDILRIRLFDIWSHEQDIREALGRPGDLDAPGAAVAVSMLFDALPRIIAKTAAVPVGNAVILDLTGPVTGRAGARVEDRDGRATGIPLFTGEPDDHADASATTITMSTRAACRRALGRRERADLHMTGVGDEEIAARVLDAMVIAP
jgi:uncharacterized protein (TIGR03083 family)